MKLTPVKKIPSYAVIIRAIHERGEVQQEALKELDRRNLWLSEEQKKQAGLLEDEGTDDLNNGGK